MAIFNSKLFVYQRVPSIKKKRHRVIISTFFPRFSGVSSMLAPAWSRVTCRDTWAAQRGLRTWVETARNASKSLASCRNFRILKWRYWGDIPWNLGLKNMAGTSNLGAWNGHWSWSFPYIMDTTIFIKNHASQTSAVDKQTTEHMEFVAKNKPIQLSAHQNLSWMTQ